MCSSYYQLMARYGGTDMFLEGHRCAPATLQGHLTCTAMSCLLYNISNCKCVINYYNGRRTAGDTKD